MQNPMRLRNTTSCCHIMASSQTYWVKHHSNSLCFGPAPPMELNLAGLQQQQQDSEALETKFPLCQTPLYSDAHSLTCRNNMLRPQEGDQVVPSFQRLTVLEGRHKRPKPLPPLPDPEELMSDEAADSEVEFFTSDQRSLLPKSCTKAPCFRASSRGSYRSFGQVNYAYQGIQSAAGGGDGGVACMSRSWPRTEHSLAAVAWTGSGMKTGANVGTSSWTVGLQKEYGEQMLTEVRNSLAKVQPAARPLSSRIRYSYSGPAYHHDHGSPTPSHNDQPEIPPRVPLPPKPSALPKPVTTKCSSSDKDNESFEKPPQIPPRVPLVPACPPRTPSPKSLPIYINGVMPATQSFAPNPKYVQKAPQQRPQRARAPPTDQCSPCIVPVIKDGRQASATHYFLLPCRPACTDRQQRVLIQSERTNDTGAWPPDLDSAKR